jgi:hypothetical protein
MQRSILQRLAKMEIKIGQRWLYQDSQYHFISEILELPTELRCKGVVVQSFFGSIKTGEIHNWSPFPCFVPWSYLEGQDKSL